MSFFNKMLASVGIGSAKIDTMLEKTSYVPGEVVRGAVHITGGNVEQAVDQIYIKVMTDYIKEADDKKIRHSHTISQFRITDSLHVMPQQKLEIPFAFDLPLETPLTLSRHPVWLHTGLDIENAIDPNDQDYIEVKPTAYTSALLEAVDSLGFSFKHATVEHDRRFARGVPFVQEIEFYPGGPFSGRLKELELVISNERDGLSVIVEVDRRAKGLSGLLESALDMDERTYRLDLTSSDFDRGTAHIAGMLSGVITRAIL